MEREKGKPHLISSLISEMVQIFNELGYSVADGPELEKEYYNFDALNIKKGHPSREMWDTFWIDGYKDSLLRTHTSNVQVRYMEKNKPPIYTVVPGKVFRNEATDSTHEAQFFQFEGLCIDKNITLADLKGTLEYLLKKLLGEHTIVRFRQSYFPFTEPSLEVDIKRESDKNWIEILGCGMVHPEVLKASGIDPKEYQGFAFGIGIDRVAILRYELDDIRDLYKADQRFLSQF